MKTQELIVAGLLTSCSVLAAGMVVQAQSPKAAATAPAPKDGWEEIDERLLFLMVRLATVEASLDAVEGTISKVSGKRSARVADAKRAVKGNELMDRNAGGPMRWTEFYGRTAEKFFYHPVDANTTYHTTTVLSQQSPQSDNQAADGVPSRQGLPVHQRPPQFDYIYRANREVLARAEKEAAELATKIDALLARRTGLEAEQAALWCEIAFRAVSRHDLARKPLYRFELASVTSETKDQERVEAMKAVATFVRSALTVVADAQQNQTKALGNAKLNVAQARETLGDAWVRQAPLATESTDVKTSAGKFAALAKRLDAVAANLSDSHTVAIDGDRFKDEQRKDTFRALLQQSLVSYAQIVLALDEMADVMAREWELKSDLDKPHARRSEAQPVTPDTTAPAVDRGNLAAVRPALLWYCPFDELQRSQQGHDQVENHGRKRDDAVSTETQATISETHERGAPGRRVSVRLGSRATEKYALTPPPIARNNLPQ